MNAGRVALTISVELVALALVTSRMEYVVDDVDGGTS
jgi:hypothetical protein